MKQIVVVAGPTASGKTAFAIRLAKALDGEIISADSMQIYRGMDIASAKPTIEERKKAVHHMIDVVSPFEPFSVADYVKRAKVLIDEIAARGHLPIVAGGTGLYISSLVDNIEFIEEETDTSVRERLFCEAEEKGIEPLYERLQAIDPIAAEKIHPNNKKRVIRALEIYETTGRTMTEQNEHSRKTPSPYDPFMIALSPAREVLYERINQRVELMAEAGLFEESRRLSDMGLKREMQSMQGIGYKEVFSYLEGTTNREECLEEIKQATRRYAKRQLTWFKRDARYRWVDSTDEEQVHAVLAACEDWYK
ncbi:MAG: tRNA (adenosine(37)-N6)-dimethylallyltransferase MiaA [Ruminococcaceae bacterium]|nr:tRNA (adenosine(37)-N6)-dimethylallyltransferase MiaA [Oscillospiraceae bacterium]